MPSQNKHEESKGRDSSSQNKKPEVVAKSVLKYYSKYQNTSTNVQKKAVMNSVFEIDSRYEVIDAIGSGAYGIVVAARDKSIPKKYYVAIKKIEKAFEHKIFTKRTLRELKILRLLKHENVVSLSTLMLPKSRACFEDIYVVTELMESDLAAIVKSSQPLSDEHTQFFIYQILRGLKYVHSAGIIHRDLKPRNLLVNSNCDLKICDFGLSRTLHNTEDRTNLTDYVATRWYRPPELLLETKEYGPAVDVWSVGCILAELLRRKPFLPGTESKHQLELIFDMFGTPCEEDIANVPKPRLRKYLRSLPSKKPKSLEAIFPKANPLAVDLLRKMFVFNPLKRISVEEALQHPYLKELHCPDDEPTRDLVPSIEFEFEKYNLSLQQLKDLLYEEILLYHFEDFRKEYFRRVFTGENPFAEVIANEHAPKPEERTHSDEEDD